MAHAVVNAALSLAKGESALAGASSAVTAEAVGLISQAYYGKNASELTDEQKQKISALASLAVGLAGGLVGGDTASAVSGAQTGKVTVENNFSAVPAPAVPVPGVPVGPGDEVKQEADKNIASKLQEAINDVADWLNKATDCSFGRACSEATGDRNINQPNIGKDLTDAEKAELGGSGSWTPGGWEPQDEENARNKEISQQNKVNFEAAKDRYPKQYDQYNKLPDKNLEKAISKHDKQITEHQNYLNDPEKRLEHVPTWEKLSSQHQENLLHHWQQDVNRHEAYKSIAEGILKGRK